MAMTEAATIAAQMKKERLRIRVDAPARAPAACHPNGVTCGVSEHLLHGDPAGRGGGGERGMVALVLVGVRLGELRHRAVEGVGTAEVGPDRDRVARARMG